MMMLTAQALEKSFTLHLQGGAKLDVLHNAAITVRAGECVALAGPSGTGKSTLLRALYGNYLVDSGEILIRHEGEMFNLTNADAQTIIEIRSKTLGYVSQFLRAIPRISAKNIVAAGADTARAEQMLTRLGIGANLQNLAPATFSGGEQQRVNLARAFVRHWPILLLDEPTASLDAANRDIVIALINEVKSKGSAVIGIFHDSFVRDAVADQVLDLSKAHA
jgi:alpha-D-ribose 1-methylphosphonate 5-triphosphate synthase subunit PhnL